MLARLFLYDHDFFKLSFAESECLYFIYYIRTIFQSAWFQTWRWIAFQMQTNWQRIDYNRYKEKRMATWKVERCFKVSSKYGTFFIKLIACIWFKALISACSTNKEIFHLYFFYIDKLPKCVYRCHDDPMPEFDFNGVQYLRNWTLLDNGIGAIATYECRRNNFSFTNQIE